MGGEWGCGRCHKQGRHASLRHSQEEIRGKLCMCVCVYVSVTGCVCIAHSIPGQHPRALI